MTDTKEPQEAEMVEAALMNIVSIARFEQEHPYGLHLTAFSVIEKNARVALAALAPASSGAGASAPVAGMILHIGTIGGNCPVQAEGTICGKPFYFRARGRKWSMEIGATIDAGNAEWECWCTWGANKFAAGWMPEDEARRLIEWCAAEYARNAISAPVAGESVSGVPTAPPDNATGLQPQEIGTTRDAGSEAP